MAVKIFLDVDGVILDFNAGFSSMLKDAFPSFYDRSKSIPEIVGDIVKHAPTPMDPTELFLDFMRGDYFTRLPSLVKPDSVKELRNYGEVNFLTNIIPAAVPQRRINLEGLGIDFGQIMLGGFEKYGDPTYPRKSEVILSSTSPDDKVFFLDDLSENYDDIEKNIPSSIPCIMRTFENRYTSLDGYRVAEKFEDFVTLVKRSL